MSNVSGPVDESQGRWHATLRFAVAGTVAFVICELMQWAPTFLAPVLAGVLLANLPGRPAPKVILGLILVMTAAALGTFAVASLLRPTPIVLAGVAALGNFLCFYAIASGKPALPSLLTLICLATIPVFVMVAPNQAGMLPVALIRGIALALAMVWMVHICWPAVSPPAPAPQSETSSPAVPPFLRALVSVAVVVPMMLVYLMFGLADVLPVLVATVMLVITFEFQKTRMQALAMVLGNFGGGLLGVFLYAVLLTTPGIGFLALLLFTALLFFGHRIAAGGPAAAVMLITCNGMLIILSSTIAAGPAPLGVWLARLFQFAIAGAFSITMMSLFWYFHSAGRRMPKTA